MSEELKSCPFCGGKAGIEAYSFGQYSVQCHACREETGRYSGMEVAIAAWNRRTPEPGTSVVRWVENDGTYETLSERYRKIIAYNERGHLIDTYIRGEEPSLPRIIKFWGYFPELPKGLADAEG
ncbi:MAG: Lar family restriction alleviation protein [Planctomycetaceae bacterium]|nr:Lar family restriction alleviation protein [Planctomycetaceae bacterium]